MNTQIRSSNVIKDKNWVMCGRGGTLDSMPRYFNIQHYLRKAARRMKRQVSSYREIYSDF